MTENFRAAAGAVAIGAVLAFAGLPAAAEPAALKPLLDGQLDKVAAGGQKASAIGASAADGETARTDAAVSSLVGGGTSDPVVGAATGLVSASATATAGAVAAASSYLSLSVTF
jgi:hypothetical protein